MQIATYFFSIIDLLMDNYFIINMLDLLNDVTCNSKINKSFIISLSVISHVINGLLKKNIISIIVLIIILLIYCISVNHINIKNTLLSISIVIANILIFNGIFIFAGTLFTLSASNMFFDDTYTFVSTLIVFFNKLILVIEYFFIKGSKDKKINIPDRAVLYFLFIEILQIIIILVFANNYVLFNKGEYYLVGGIVFFCIENILLYKIATLLSVYFDTSIKKQLYIDAIKHEKEVIDTVHERYNFINRWNHDLKNILLSIKSQTIYDKQNLNNSLVKLEKLIEKIDTENKYVLVNNNTINYILNSKIEKIKKLGVDIKVIINGKIPEDIDELDISMLLTSILENALLIAREYSSSIFDFIIQINKEKNQLLIKTINYCNENNINNKEVKKLRNYEISKLNKLCSNNNRMFYQSHHDNEIITVILINL